MHNGAPLTIDFLAAKNIPFPIVSTAQMMKRGYKIWLDGPESKLTNGKVDIPVYLMNNLLYLKPKGVTRPTAGKVLAPTVPLPEPTVRPAVKPQGGKTDYWELKGNLFETKDFPLHTSKGKTNACTT